MATQHEKSPDADARCAERDRRAAAISRHVIQHLGEPNDLLRVAVLPLWSAYYRVNILVGAHPSSARVAQSYFLQVDDDGKVLVAMPEITRRY